MVATVVPNASGRLIKQLKRIKIAGIDAHDFFINGPGLIQIARLMQRRPCCSAAAIKRAATGVMAVPSRGFAWEPEAFRGVFGDFLGIENCCAC